MNLYGSGMHQFSDDEIRNVCVIRIDINSMKGKSTIEGYSTLLAQSWWGLRSRTILSPVFCAFITAS
jgi:hypothetical protein